MATSKITPLEKQCARLIAEWQKRLGLDHWRVDFRVYGEDLDCYAEVCADPTHCHAHVKVRDPETIRPKEFGEWSGVRDLECTLVHELLHIRNRSFENVVCTKKNTKSGVYDLYEQALEHTARALVAAKRGLPVILP